MSIQINHCNTLSSYRATRISATTTSKSKRLRLPDENQAPWRFTVRLSALIIAPKLFRKNNACSAIYTDYLTFFFMFFLQKPTKCNLSQEHQILKKNASKHSGTQKGKT